MVNSEFLKKLPSIKIPVFILLSFFIIINSYSQQSQFGQNKVQYKVFDWKFIQSKHSAGGAKRFLCTGCE